MKITDHQIDVGEVAARILADRRKVVRVSEVEILALAQYAVIPLPIAVPASLAASVSAVLRDHQALSVARVASMELADTVEAFNRSMKNLQTIFEKEFPDASD